MATNTTIKDVARHAGVSITTVSHVLNDGPNRARYTEETAQRVVEAAQHFRYAPSRLAHNMRKGVNKVISIFSHMSSAGESGYQCMIFAGAAMALQELGYTVEIVNPWTEPNLTHVLENTDGVLFSVDVDPKETPLVQRSGVPAVGVNLGRFEPADCVEPDDRAGARSIGEHLVAQGYERVIYVHRSKEGAGPGHASIHVREAALADAVKGCDFTTLTLNREVLQPVIDDLRRRAPRRTAFVAYSDSARLAIQQMLSFAGLLIPDDVGMASCHTGLFGHTLDLGLPITGVTYRVTELGAAGARMLLDRIRAGGASVPSVLVPETFIEGRTTRRQG